MHLQLVIMGDFFSSDASKISQSDRDFDDMFASTYEDEGTLKI